MDTEYFYVMTLDKGIKQATVYGSFYAEQGHSYTEKEIFVSVRAGVKDLEDGAVLYWNLSKMNIGYTVEDYSYIITYERDGVKNTVSDVVRAGTGSSKHKLFQTIKEMNSIVSSDTILYWHLEKDTL